MNNQEKLLRYLESRGYEVKVVEIKPRECDDVPLYIKRIQRAHSDTGNSKLRFGA